jgi:hypothetical protein
MNTNTTRKLVTVPVNVTVIFKVTSAKPVRIRDRAYRKMVEAAVSREIFRAENRFYYGA